MGSAIFGLLAACILTFFTLKAASTEYAIFINLMGIAFVVGGSLAAAVATFSLKEVFGVFSSFWRALKRRNQDAQKVTRELVEVANLLNRSPQAFQRAFAQVTSPFLKDGLRLIQNGFENNQIKHIMSISVAERKSLLLSEAEVLRMIAKYPPALGMVGTVIGLVALLHGMSGTVNAASVGTGMSMALTTTLYGLLLSNYLLIPMADNLLLRLKHDLHIRRVILEGVLLLNEGQDPVYIQEVLNAYLRPGNRAGLADLAVNTNDSVAA